ncbi:group II intron reverse transcriptase/maturase [Chitinimonas sp. PSY-7]|uniref:group II intron reverse transcriptase/maturase n=1 Tax=Chitinimonas sp. PSY-7 TaxID=3459088 RepID=UPI00403FCD44
MPVEERGLSSEPTLKVGRDRRLGNLATPISVQKLQTALHAKAKEEPEFRFYALYDKICRMDVLRHAYACCRANKGAPGIDGLTFDDVEQYGQERWLGELAQQLRERTYRPEAVRRVFIPKPNGKLRPLGIPRLAERVCQTAAMLVLEPIFEADLPPEQHAYRQNRNAQSAVREVHGLLTSGYKDVVDADLSGYFDTIPHVELMKSVARRVIDRQVLHLVKMWLDAPVEEVDKRGRKKRTTINRDIKQGIPQGSPISPLLSNLYMRRFILGWKKAGLEQRLSARIVNYADDLVICCKSSRAKVALDAMRQIMTKLKLTVNEDKTRTCRLPEGEFDFLGYTFGRRYSSKNGRPYIATRPSKKSIKCMTEAIHVQTGRNLEWRDAGEMVTRLNQKLGGWANYFCLGPVTPAYRFIDKYTTTRLRRWPCKKRKQHGKGIKRYPDEYFYEQLGLIRLPKLPQGLPWAKA